VGPFDTELAPVDATDDELRRLLAEAELPPLLPALAYATGDLSLLRHDLRPDPALIVLPQGGLSPEQQETARELAFDALRRFRDGGSRPVPPPAEEQLLAMLEQTVGTADMAPYLPLLEEELSYRGEDRRAPGWHKGEVAPDREFTVAVIGAGMSGILAAHRLGQAGVSFVVLEKDGDVGGTWLENTYPGCRVDNPNHNYSYAFAQRHDWPFHFSTQDVLLEYFRSCADAFDVRPHIRFNTEVLAAAWDETTAAWSIDVRSEHGEETVRANAVISAVGQLNRPKYPTEIDGFGSFGGPAFHSARWRHDLDLNARRVAVIGTGASAVQFIPEVAREAGQVVVFQRTPPWLGPTPDYHEEVSEGQRWLYKHVPAYSEFNRFSIFWKMGDGVLAGVRVDPDYPPRKNAVSAANDLLRTMFEGYLQGQFTDRPDLLEKVVPDYPPGAKRVLRDNGIWPATLKRDNVELVTTDIDAITPSGVRTADGVEHKADVLVYGTGFHASSFLTPMRVIGRGGIDLHEHWGGEARAYLGITIPGFPNFFCLYGPNTNIVINGSIVYFSECGVRYVLGCLGLLLESGERALEVRKDVHDEFNERVDTENRAMAWGHSDVNSWYKNASGRVSQNWPFTLLEYWQRTLEPNKDDFELG
jgi:4-hydroxyacetophenone monooxygenase